MKTTKNNYIKPGDVVMITVNGMTVHSIEEYEAAFTERMESSSEDDPDWTSRVIRLDRSDRNVDGQALLGN
jgi:hypothetical protein